MIVGVIVGVAMRSYSGGKQREGCNCNISLVKHRNKDRKLSEIFGSKQAKRMAYYMHWRRSELQNTRDNNKQTTKNKNTLSNHAKS